MNLSPEPANRPPPERALQVATADRAPSNVARQVGRLTVLLQDTPELTPRHARLAARVTRDLSIVAARSAADGTGADLRVELGDLARALHAAARSNRGEIALAPTTHRTLEVVLHDLHAFTKEAFASRTDLAQADANRLVRRLPDLVGALAEVARTQVDGARWAIPDRREGERPAYAVASTADPDLQPPILRDLRRAEAAAESFRARLALPALTDLMTARRTMKTALALLDDCRRSYLTHGSRPPHPALPIRPLIPGSGLSNPSL